MTCTLISDKKDSIQEHTRTNPVSHQSSQKLLFGQVLKTATTMPHTPQVHPKLHLSLVKPFQNCALFRSQCVPFLTDLVILCNMYHPLTREVGMPNFQRFGS